MKNLSLEETVKKKMGTILHIARHITAKHSSIMTSSNLQIMNTKTIEMLMTKQLATVELDCIIKTEY